MADGKPFHNPFGVLAGLGSPVAPVATDAEPARPDAVRPAPPRPASSAHTASTVVVGQGRGPARAVVRLERSGRGGKAVTVIDHLGLPAADRDVWLKALKAALGCGGSLEGEQIVLQGDQRPRVPALLTARGVRKVTVS